MEWKRFSNPLSHEERVRAEREAHYWGGERGPADYSGRIRLFRVRLNQGGYNSYGRYFGRGEPLFHVESDDIEGTIDQFIRAMDRDDAKRIVRSMYPNAKFFR